MCTIAFLLDFDVGLAGQSDNPNSGSWSGITIKSDCSEDEAFAEAAKCTEKDVPGAKLSLHDDSTMRIFIVPRAAWSDLRQHEC